MPSRQYQLAASATASLDAAVNLAIARRGVIRAVQWSVIPVSAQASGDYVRVELSVASVGQFATNDAQGVISGVGVGFFIVTSGSSPGCNECHLCQCDVEAGQKLYLNINENGGGTWAIRCIITVEER